MNSFNTESVHHPKRPSFNRNIAVASVVVLLISVFSAVFVSQQKQDNRSKASEPTPIVLANSVNDFSGVQGYKGWYYGYANGAYNGSNFQQLGIFQGLWFLDPNTYWLQISRENMHPNSNITSYPKQPGQFDVVKRWVSSAAGTITISGNVADLDGTDSGSGEDGIIASIYVDGQKVYEKAIANFDAVGDNYSVTANVHVGSKIDFAVAPANNDYNDTTRFDVVITKLAPTPTPALCYDGSTSYTCPPTPTLALGARTCTFVSDTTTKMSVNLALNRPATASTTWSYQGGYEAAKAFDGNLSTRWNSEVGNLNDQWVSVDLGANTTYNSVVLKEYTEHAHITSYRLQSSNDGVSYSDISGTTGSSVGADKVINFSPATSRYMRFYINSTASATPTLHEIEVYNTNNPTVGAVASYQYGNYASIPGATWVWSSYNVQNPTIDETKTFTKIFTLTQPHSASLTMYADNSFSVWVNGTQRFAEASNFNFTQADGHTYDLLPYMQDGLNVLSIQVTNLGVAGATPQSNPAGLLYTLAVNGNECMAGAPAATATAAPTASLPSVSITSPTAGAVVNGTVPVTTNTSSDVTKVEFYVDDVLKSTDTTAPYGFSWDTTNGGTQPCDGSHNHSLYAKAYNAANLSTTTSPIVIVVSNPPYCSLTPTILPTISFAPSATNTPFATILGLNLLLHGVGNGGDNANPGATGNQTPLHTTRTVKVDVYNAQNALVVSKEGQVNFVSSTGNFTGTVDLGQVASGPYTVKIKSDQYLRSQVSGIQNLTSATTNVLPQTSLTSGDINGDNQVNIIDYNILMGCYSDLSPAVSCTPANKLLADLTDDGNVNQFDYNLFLREISNIGGR